MTIRDKLEKIANTIVDTAIFVKDISVLAVKDPKTLMAVGAVMGMTYGGAEARGIAPAPNYTIKSKISSLPTKVSIVQFGHYWEATEGFDTEFDGIYLPPQAQGFGSFVQLKELDAPKISSQTRNNNSTSTSNYISETTGDNISGTIYYKFEVDKSIESNTTWKNVFFERYGKDANLSDSNNVPIKIWDVKYMGGQLIPSYVSSDSSINNPTSGIADQAKILEFNSSDLNKDKNVDFQDFAILAKNMGRTNITKGINPNDANDYADITNIYDGLGHLISYGNGSVGFEDLEQMTSEWLWVEDPNTW